MGYSKPPLKKNFKSVPPKKTEEEIIKQFLFESKDKPVTQKKSEIEPDEFVESESLPPEISKLKVSTTFVDKTEFPPKKLSETTIDFILLFQFLYQFELMQKDDDKKLKPTKEGFNKVLNSLGQETFGEKKIKISADKLDFLINSAKRILVEQDEFDERFIPLLQNWTWERVSPLKKNILRIASFLIKEKIKSPKFIVNEAINTSKWFGEEKDYMFINAVLQKAYLN